MEYYAFDNIRFLTNHISVYIVFFQVCSSHQYVLHNELHHHIQLNMITIVVHQKSQNQNGHNRLSGFLNLKKRILVYIKYYY